jgi:hypothetical protein
METAVPAGYVALTTAVVGGGYIRHRVAHLWPTPSSQLPLHPGSAIEKPVERVQPMVVVKYVVSWMAALVHGWALLDRVDELGDNAWRLVKPAAWLLAWVTEPIPSLPGCWWMGRVLKHGTGVCMM